MLQVAENRNGSERLSSRAAAEFQQVELKASLEATKLCRVLVIQSRAGALKVLFSVNDNKLAQWHDVLRKLVPALERLPYDVSIGQKCMTVDGRLVAPWLLQVETPNAASLRVAVQDVRKCFMRLANLAVDEPRRDDYSWLHDKLDAERELPEWDTPFDVPDRRE